MAEADVKLGLAEAAELITLAFRLDVFALAATIFPSFCSGGHELNLEPLNRGANVPLVT